MDSSERVRVLANHAPGAGPVVYWCTAARRMHHNHGLERAANLAKEIGQGLVIVEALRANYPYASPRFHAFIMQGMQDNAAAAAQAGIPYIGHVESGPKSAMLADMAAFAGVIVTDDHPGFFYPAMLHAASKVGVRLEAVDSNGLIPLAATPKAFVTAYQFRRWLQKHLPDHLMSLPARNPLEGAAAGTFPTNFCKQYPNNFDGDPAKLAPSGPDPVAMRGGAVAAAQQWQSFLPRMGRYLESNHPDDEASSGMSPYLHFGHASSSAMVADILDSEGWSPSHLGDKTNGAREGWWGLSEAAEAFLDQLVTWRELGFVELHHRPDATGFDMLPDWAKATLAQHATDPRQTLTLADLEIASSPDPVWNAAQRQLLEQGIIHNYMRMVWGKRILEWAPDPATALEWMYHLNDTYALDGRDPNSVSGIMWCLGRYDRAWQERDIFGKVRYMSSQNTLRKLRCKEYMRRFGEPASRP